MITTMYITAARIAGMSTAGVDPRRCRPGERSDQRIGPGTGSSAPIGCHGSAVEHSEQHADEDKDRDRNGDIDHQLAR